MLVDGIHSVHVRVVRLEERPNSGDGWAAAGAEGHGTLAASQACAAAEVAEALHESAKGFGELLEAAELVAGGSVGMPELALGFIWVVCRVVLLERCSGVHVEGLHTHRGRSDEGSREGCLRCKDPEPAGPLQVNQSESTRRGQRSTLQSEDLADHVDCNRKVAVPGDIGVGCQKRCQRLERVLLLGGGTGSQREFLPVRDLSEGVGAQCGLDRVRVYAAAWRWGGRRRRDSDIELRTGRNQLGAQTHQPRVPMRGLAGTARAATRPPWF